jgi:hypothetical protein
MVAYRWFSPTRAVVGFIANASSCFLRQGRALSHQHARHVIEILSPTHSVYRGYHKKQFRSLTLFTHYVATALFSVIEVRFCV